METEQAAPPPPPSTEAQEHAKVKEVLTETIALFQKHQLSQGQYLIVLQCLVSGALSTETRQVEKTFIKLLEKEIKRARKVMIQNRPAEGSA